VGPIVAAYLLGYSGDIGRFPSAGHYARYNATAPIEASSGPVVRHRLNPRGNRQLNHALHMIAVTQVRNDTPPAAATTSASRPSATAAKKPCDPSNDASATPSTANSCSTAAAEQRAREGTRERLQWPA
jgi:Transposase IS116/IS110/IS902 family